MFTDDLVIIADTERNYRKDYGNGGKDSIEPEG